MNFRDFLGPSLGGALLDLVGFNQMCTYTAIMCLIMVGRVKHYKPLRLFQIESLQTTILDWMKMVESTPNV